MTAVEWLIEELTRQNMYMHLFEKEIKQAKEMEKEQLADAWYAGDEDGPIHDFEDYYNETYGSKGSDDHIVNTNEMVSSQTEISDEEIEKAARDYDNAVIYGPPLLHFEQGAFWYREQLKQRQ